MLTALRGRRQWHLDPEAALKRELFLTNRMFSDGQRQSALLTPETRVKSLAEEAVKWGVVLPLLLSDPRFNAYYEIGEFPIPSLGRTFRPDFQVELTFGGRQLFIDPHYFPPASRFGDTAVRAEVDRRNADFHEKGTGFHMEYAPVLEWVVICDRPNRRTRAMADVNWKARIPLADPVTEYLHQAWKLGDKMEKLIRRSDQARLLSGRKIEALRWARRIECMNELENSVGARRKESGGDQAA